MFLKKLNKKYLPSAISSFFPDGISVLPLLPPFFGFLFLVCIPSLRIARGRLTPCNLKYNPHALQTGSPSLLRRHNVVARVPQFVQQRPKRRFAVWIKKGKLLLLVDVLTKLTVIFFLFCI